MLNSITLSGVILFLFDWIIRIGFIFYIPRKRKPSSAIAWLLIICFVPGIGILLFILIGTPKLSKKRLREQKQVDLFLSNRFVKNNEALDNLTREEYHRIRSLAELNQSLGKLPLTFGNEFKILPEYNKILVDIIQEITKAKQSIDIEYFIVALDETTQPFFDSLALAIKRGVKVRMLIDGMGYRKYPRRKEMHKLLTDIGVDWHIMLKPTLRLKNYNRFDLRNHRKILVIDNKIAYIGSQNIVDRTYHRKDEIYYDELVAKMSGPIVGECSIVFAQDWYFETNQKLEPLAQNNQYKFPSKTGDVIAQLLPSGPGFNTLNNAKLFASLIHKAQKRIVITNPYFVPEEAILDALTSAAYRGVDVTIINSEAIDQWMVGHAQRSYYQELMTAGIKIYLYKYPVLLHSKHITIDDDMAIIGSSNMDIRSFELDSECIVFTYGKSVVDQLNKVQSYNLSKSKQVNPTTWKRRSVKQNFLDSVARLTSALQ